MNISKQKIKKIFEDLQLYWNKPPYGRYMPFKEIASLAAGGMGVKFICYAVQTMILSVGNTLIGNTIGIPPRELYVIYIISVLSGFPLTALRAKMVDNSKSSKGKFRPYIFTMAIPTVLLAIGFTWMPYDKMTMLWKCITVLAFNIGFQFFYMFMFDSYTNIINVLSPNTYERSDVNSVTAVVDSFSPTIIGFLMPLLANWITGENTIYDMKIYRAVYPPILLLGLLLTIFIYLNTQEKIVQAKTHEVHIKFTDSLRAVAKNKYFWIISLAGWLGFLESSFGTILAWLYNYQNACTPLQYSIVTAVYGNSALWSMLFAPFLIRKIGKRNLLIVSNVLSIFFILMMYPVVTDAPKNMVIWLMLGCMFINGLGTALGNLLTYSLNGDIRDYQQYISGERIDGIFLAMGLITSVVTMITGFVLPAIYDLAGLNETVAKSLGYDGSNVYYVLYNDHYFKKICGILVIASAIGAALNAIPYFFYDLTEKKQKAMVTVLKIRALFEDYGNGALSDERLVEAIDIIEESQNYISKEIIKPSKKEITEAKKSGDKEKIKTAKSKYKQRKEDNEKIEIAQYVMKEIHKFESTAVQIQVERANKICEKGINGLYTLNTISLKDAKALPKISEDEKEIRLAMIEIAHQEKQSKKLLSRYYKNGIKEFDSSVFNSLISKISSLEERKNVLINEIKQERKSSQNAMEAKKELSEIKKQIAMTKRSLKHCRDEFSLYNRAAKPFLDAKKLLTQQDNYLHYNEIKNRYNESKARAEAQKTALSLQEKRNKAEKEAYAKKLKEARKKQKAKNESQKHQTKNK